MRFFPNIYAPNIYGVTSTGKFISLCIGLILVGIGYLVLPGYAFWLSLLFLVLFSVGIANPEYTFYLMLFILVEEMVHIYISFPPYYEGRIYPYQAVLLINFVCLFFVFAREKRAIRSTPIDALVWLIIFYELFSVLWTPVPEVGVFLCLYLLSYFFLFHLITNIVVNETILARTVNIIILGGIISATAIILSQWFEISKTIVFTESSGIKLAFQQQVSRAAGLAGTDHVAGFASIAASFVLAKIVWEKQFGMKAFYTLIYAYLLCGIITTTSRGVAIGAVGAFVFFILIQDKLRNTFIKNIFVYGLLIIIVVLLAKPGFIDRLLVGFGYTGDLIFSDMSFQGTEADISEGQGLSGMEIRWVWWKNGLYEMILHPLKILFGLGIGGFIVYSAGDNTVCSPEGNNVAVSFFLDMGLFGIITLLILMYLLVKHLGYWVVHGERSYSYYLFIGSLTALVAETGIHGLVDYDIVSYAGKYLWFPLALTMAAMNIVKDESSKGDDHGDYNA